ncbi:MAG TPA: hypothetical protein VHX42_02350 [Candidatus Babeliales bacterium]|nr:hypothetical protein [Candidatus Babeliales bacterium]
MIKNATPEDFTVNFSNLLIDQPYEIALINMNLWYSWYNIADFYNNNDIRISNGAKWINITIPNGIYDIEQLNDFIKRRFTAANEDADTAKIIPNQSSLRVIIELKQNCQFDLSRSDLHKILGFEKKIVKKTEEGSEPVDITRGVDVLCAHCNIVSGSYDNNMASDILYSFNPASEPGSLISVSPINPVYLPVCVQNDIQYITMKLTDQKSRPINLNGQHVNYLLHLRPRKQAT